MSTLAILTATYNHPYELRRLYESLQNQTSKDFRWIIIDDGSSHQTEEMVESFFQKPLFEIVYRYQENNGKSSAINKGLDCLDTEQFVLIVDDDEVLNKNAVKIVIKYITKYQDTDCVAIDFNHYDLITKKRLANYNQQDDYFMSVQERKSKRISSDGYTGYYVNAIKDIRFPIYKGEKYIGPSVIMMYISRKGKILWANAVIGGTEYLENGITKTGRKLRVKNPCGMIVYCNLLQENGSSSRTKIIYSLMGYAYVYLAKYLQHDIEKNEYHKLNRFLFLPGCLLGLYWRKKYIGDK